jgi:subtilisin family serine protease
MFKRRAGLVLAITSAALTLLALGCGVDGNGPEPAENIISGTYDPPEPSDIVDDSELGGKVIANRIVVKLGGGAEDTMIDSLVASINGDLVGSIPDILMYSVRIPEASEVDSIIAAMETNPLVQFAVRDAVLELPQQSQRASGLSDWGKLSDSGPNLAGPVSEPYYMGQHDALALVRAQLAWEVTSGSRDVYVAVLDTGIDLDHRDLGFGGATPRFYYSMDDKDLTDMSGHGTWVAGLIHASGDNGIGVAGLAWKCRLIPCKVSEYDEVNAFVGASALVSVANFSALTQTPTVVNMSWASDFVGTDAHKRAFGTVLWSAIEYADIMGCLLVASSGNDAGSISKGDPLLSLEDKVYPASFPEVLAVGAVTNEDEFQASLSNFGASVMSAPDRNWSTGIGGGYVCPRGQGLCCGTSFAAPMVAGTAALVWSANPELSKSEVMDILISSADRGIPSADKFGLGRVNAFRAVMAALGEFLHEEDKLPAAPEWADVPCASGDSQVELFWKDVTTNYDGTSADDAVGCNVWTVLPTFEKINTEVVAGTSCLVQGLDNGVEYTFVICSVDSLGQVGPVSRSRRLTPGGDTCLDQALVAYFPFNGDASDESDYGNHGIVYGATPTKDRFGNAFSAYDFDGLNDYIRVPDAGSLNFGTGDFAVSVFVNAHSIVEPDAMYPGSVIIDKRYTYDSGMHTPGYNQWQLKWWLGNHINFMTYSYDGSEVRSTAGLEFNRWYHIVAVREGTEMSVYIDGQLAVRASATIRDVSTPMDVFIGVDGKHFSHDVGSKCFFDGAMDDMRIYRRALSGAEITALYSEGTPISEP